MIKNRATRRKHALRVVNNVIKGREVALQKAQYGFGINVTNQLCAIIFWRWTWVLWDHRAKSGNSVAVLWQFIGKKLARIRQKVGK